MNNERCYDEYGIEELMELYVGEVDELIGFIKPSKELPEGEIVWDVTCQGGVRFSCPTQYKAKIYAQLLMMNHKLAKLFAVCDEVDRTFLPGSFSSVEELNESLKGKQTDVVSLDEIPYTWTLGTKIRRSTGIANWHKFVEKAMEHGKLERMLDRGKVYYRRHQ